MKASFLRSSITNPRDLLAACIESYAASCRRLKAQATVAEEIDAGPKIWNPACAAIVVIVNLTEGTAQYVQLADCRLNYVMAGTTGLSGGYRNPYHNACKRNPVLGLNGYAQNVLYKGGITPNELLSVENTCIRHNRALLYNTQNGCAVFNGEPEMLEAPMAEGKLEGFTHLLLTSDGFEFPQLEVVVDNTLDLASVYKTFIEDDFTIKGTPVPFDATALLWQPRE